MRDADIRCVIKKHLHALYIENKSTMIVEELGLQHGSARIDVAVIGDYLHGFEFKSDSDTLRRLDDQVRVYNAVLDRVTLVVGYHLASKAIERVPSWWGIKLAEFTSKGIVKLSEARSARNNPAPDSLAIAQLLWKEEALEILEDVNAAGGVKSKPRWFVYQRLVDSIDLNSLRNSVRAKLKIRIARGFVEKQIPNDDLNPHESKSSHCPSF